MSSGPSESVAPKRGKSVIGNLAGEILTDIGDLFGALANPVDLLDKPNKKRIW